MTTPITKCQHTYDFDAAGLARCRKCGEEAQQQVVPVPSPGPYRVEVERDGCEHCGAGRMWTVGANEEGADLIFIGLGFDLQEDAEELAEYMNQAYCRGARQGYETDRP